MTYGEGQVYFAVDPKGYKYVKIGFSSNPIARMSSIMDCPSGRKPNIAGLEWGGREREKELHRKFAKYRKRGEWFVYAPEIQTYVEALPRLKPMRPESVALRFVDGFAVVQVRVTCQEDETLSAIADRENLTRRETLDLMFDYAYAHMPKGYTGR